MKNISGCRFQCLVGNLWGLGVRNRCATRFFAGLPTLRGVSSNMVQFGELHDIRMIFHIRKIPNVLYPICRYTHKGFPHPTPCAPPGPLADGPSMRRGGVEGGVPYGCVSIVNTRFWIFIYIYLYTKIQLHFRLRFLHPLRLCLPLRLRLALRLPTYGY